MELDALNGVRLIITCAVIFGNTYYFLLKGPLQNVEVIQEWMSDFLFSFVIETDLFADIFFWMSAFLGSYLLLVKIKNNEG